MSSPEVTFYGGVGATTGANIMLQFEGRKILVDCGLLQGGQEEKNFQPFKYDPAEAEFLIITHAHMDHIGKVPKLVRDGFRGKIISTPETRELSLPMLEDALRVMSARYPNRTLFDEGDIDKAFSLWEGHRYGEKVELFDRCFLEMQDAGHILGSAICNIELTPSASLASKGEPNRKIKIAFTGDLGNSPSPLLPDTQIPEGVDFMVMESVYGDRNHESKKERRGKLKQYLLEGIKKNGTIVIPAFSIERTQVLLYEINNMLEDREIPEVPVFLDSPLALKVTGIYQKYTSDFKDSVRQEIKEGDDIFSFPGLKIVRNFRESGQIEETAGAKIIIAGSGMSEGGRVINHEARYLPDPDATIILVGYQSIGSLGRAIEDGKKEVFIDTDGNRENGKEKVKVRATIRSITGYSSHKDSEHLLEFVEQATSPRLRLGLSSTEERQGKQTSSHHKLKRVFVIMGEPKSSLFLAQRIHDYLDIDAIYPEEGKAYKLN